MQTIATCLMFEGQAEEAMKLYVSLFKDSKIDILVRYGADQKKLEGKVVHGEFTLAGLKYIAMDNASGEKSVFTLSCSMYVTCQTEPEIDSLYDKLAKSGTVMMEFQKYPFAEKYAWITDRFGVSWQLFLPKTK